MKNVFYGRIPPYTEVLEYKHGSTWNDGGSWYSGIFKLEDGRIISAYMPSDYCCEDIKINDVEVVMVPKYKVIDKAK